MDQATVPACDVCHRTKSELPFPLKYCRSCRQTRYCSRHCQKKGWISHKSVCNTYARSNSTADISTLGLSQLSIAEIQESSFDIPSPFTAISNGTWLHNRPQKDVYKLLIDVYRIRLEDRFKLQGEVETGSLYSGASLDEVKDSFRQFLNEVVRLDSERASKLLPSWWSTESVEECLDVAQTDDFSNIGHTVEECNIEEYYKDDLMPTQLRMYGEKLDGTKTCGESSVAVLEILTQIESNNVPAEILDWSKL